MDNPMIPCNPPWSLRLIAPIRVRVWRILCAAMLLIGPCWLAMARAGTDKPRSDVLTGPAEDLWGNRIDLAQYAQGTTIIQPFSTSNCGYCLVDGEFFQRSYFENNIQAGGHNFLLCPFNPQLDIYSHVKHFRDAATPVLVFPPGIDRYHLDGFPYLTAFREGHRVFGGVACPHEKTFRSLREKLWPGRESPLRLASPVKMAETLLVENDDHRGVLVVPDGDTSGYEHLCKRLEKATSSVVVRFEKDLTEEDVHKNLYFYGKPDAFRYDVLQRGDKPIRITPAVLEIGAYCFPTKEMDVFGCFPNPNNPEAYVVLRSAAQGMNRPMPHTHTDFTIAGKDANGQNTVLLEGGFEKNDNRWGYSESLMVASPEAAKYRRPDTQQATQLGAASPLCVCEKCLLSATQGDADSSERNIRVSDWVATDAGAVRTFGTSKCRFPSMAEDANGICWVTWEENGNILLASANKPGKATTMVVEGGRADSFNPVAAFDGSRLWVFYISNPRHYYRLYGRYFDGRELSKPQLVSSEEPIDVITPAVASARDGKILVAWTDWWANFRFLRYRVFTDGHAGKVQDALVKGVTVQGDSYQDAWWPSLATDAKGRVWGAWNQHYPVILGVCAGDLVSEGSSVTKVVNDDPLSDENENGGYPSAAIDAQGRKWVFWASFEWHSVGFPKNTPENTPVRIFASYYDEAGKDWVGRQTLTTDEQPVISRTPKAAVDRNGVIRVVWSSRGTTVDRPWEIRISSLREGEWSKPARISQEGVSSQAPNILPASDGSVWVCWHQGTGDKMQVCVLHLRAAPEQSGGAK
ncbi:hypothetical protein MUP01_00600 [Candidatus Bathyarchaeota archaeon]|nr:hypothetical protein [Candidatus Bathyarchaeota archaeon]